MDNAHEIIVKSPGDCFSAEIREFVGLVEQGGEVEVGGLQQRVMEAANLAFRRISGHLTGVAALKRPNVGYRSKVASGSGVALPPDLFPYELGWVFIAPEARGNGYAQPLSQAALSQAGNCGVFATSRTDNVAMHRVLTNLGFEQTGSAYPSAHGDHHLQLFTRVPPNNSFKPKPLRGSA